MPKGSEELTNARKEEIVDACAALYKTMSFKDITLRNIGEKTSFTRTSIYNYFRTKEDIFLALLKRENDEWIADMRKMTCDNSSLDAETFAAAMTGILEKRTCMLKLMAMNIYDMEANSSKKNLVEFKKSYAEAVSVLDECLKKFFPIMTDDDRKEFSCAFFPFMFGIYPYTSHTEKQMEAMKQAGVKGGDCTLHELVKPFLFRMIRSFL